MGGSISFGNEFEGLVAEAAEIGGYLWQKGWAERNAGNLSVNVTEHVPANLPVGLFPFVEKPLGVPGLAKKCFLTTRTGSRFRDVAAKPERNLAVLLLSENPEGYYVVWGGKGQDHFQATSDLASHLLIHKMLVDSGRPETTLLHTHPDELIALSHAPSFEKEEAFNGVLWKMMPEVKMFGGEGLGLIPYQLPGTREQASATVKVFQSGRRAILWEKHGVLAAGRGPRRAFDLIDLYNKAAVVYLKCKAAGFEPKGLSGDELAALEKAFPPTAT